MNDRERAELLVSKMTFAEKMAQMRYDALPIERLGIPAYNWWNECLHGVARSGRATVFPQAIGMASSFNTELMYAVADAISDEARAKYNEYKKFGETEIYQGLTMWSPNINIFRDPRWGRGQETYGEDPYLTGRMAVAFIQGLQGNGRYRKVDATIKHYAVHSGPEDQRHGFNAEVTQKDLYETYLWAFKYCIDNADPSAVMGAYNSVNGDLCSAGKKMLREILRQELHFDGYVVSDCGAICDINKYHKATKNEAESAAMAVNNGCDLNCGNAYKWLKTAATMGLVSEETITDSVVRLFTARYRLGMFDTYCEYDKIPYEVVECEKHRELNRKMAQESIVLLKNDGILPLKEDVRIAVIGPNADDVSVLLGNYNGTPSYYTTILRGIQENAKGQVLYARGCELYDDAVREWAEKPMREAIIAAQKSDVVVLVMGLNPYMEGEEGDEYNGFLSGDKKDLEFPAPQKKLYEAIVKTGKKIVFVNVSGSCLNLYNQDRECSAVLQCFYPGAEGGRAFADILYGHVSPSGRLPVTFYRSVEDLPLFKDYSMDNRTYKFYKGKPVYEFGYGLTFSEIQEKWVDENHVEVHNVGEYDTAYTVLKYEWIPHKSLCGFQKIFLRKGETIEVRF